MGLAWAGFAWVWVGLTMFTIYKDLGWVGAGLWVWGGFRRGLGGFGWVCWVCGGFGVLGGFGLGLGGFDHV